RMNHITVYRARLGALPGCRVQEYPKDRETSGNYFVLFVTNRAKRSRDEVYEALKAAGIQTKRYFYPPVHVQKIFQRYPMRVSLHMEATEKSSREGLALPLYSHMTASDLEQVCVQVESLLS
ncbi:MAG: DegT/DnrJ/EryC1/StrS family aminotransferase, partial [Nitrospira sp.]